MPADPAAATLLVHASYRLAPDDVAAFAALASRMAAAARRRDGCVFLTVTQDLDDPSTFHLFEGWRDQPALDAHGASLEFQAIMTEAASLKIVERIIDVYSVADAKRLDLRS